MLYGYWIRRIGREIPCTWHRTALLGENPKYSAKTLAESIGITIKAIEKQLSKLKAEGKIERIGPNKGGSWKVN